AVLVAMASALADANGPASTSSLEARLASLSHPGRALATVLANAAEELRDDWTASARRTATSGAGLALANVASDDLDLRPATNVVTIDSRGLDCAPSDRRTATHRRLLNLPPPALS